MPWSRMMIGGFKSEKDFVGLWELIYLRSHISYLRTHISDLRLRIQISDSVSDFGRTQA